MRDICGDIWKSKPEKLESVYNTVSTELLVRIIWLYQEYVVDLVEYAGGCAQVDSTNKR